MSEVLKPKKQTSQRRKQQNVQAQKNYRERQKKHMQALEALISSGESQEFSHVAREHQLSESPGSLASRGSDTTQSSQALSLISKHIGALDDESISRIEAGNITIQDILRAGLDALQQQEQQQSPQASSSPSDASAIILRTDQIIVPINSMRISLHTIPDVYSNHLRIKQFSTMAAVRANAEILGLTFEHIIQDESISPFYSSSNAGDEDVIEKFAHIKPDLRPTKAQLKHIHHPYIDLIPCPTFRQRCIEMAAMDPPMINEDELCEDFEKDGLICWGSSLGNQNAATGSGAPWDIRSWEAQPWFLKKWWLLVGGPESTLFQQSKWWHEMRGDQLPDSW